MIRFCLLLHAKSPAAYKELRDSSVLVLPSQRTLQDYRNFFKPKPGFNSENIERLKDLCSDHTGIQRYVVLSLDEIKIQSTLVFDKRSNELIGFVDLADEHVNEASGDELATHALVFLIRGVAIDLKYTLGYFLTKDVTSYQIMSLFWKAVCVLEVACNFGFVQLLVMEHPLTVGAMCCTLVYLITQVCRVKLSIPQLTCFVQVGRLISSRMLHI